MKQSISTLGINICIAVLLTALSVAEVYWLKYNMHFPVPAAISVIGIANGSLYVFYYVATQTKVFWFAENSVPAVLTQGLVYAVLCLFVVKWTLDALFPTIPLLPLWSNTFYFFGIKSWVLLSFFGMMFYMGKIIAEQTRKINVETNVQQLKNDAELFKLRQQLHPHFLFNSLNSINALIGVNPKLAREMLMKLSTFLRQTLKKEDDELVFLSNELEELDLYLDIEKVRFGDRLLVQKSVPERISDIKIPPFLLQPLVENAIKFGLYGTLGDVTIVINFTEMEHFFKFEISNPYDSESIAPKGTGFGLKSISRRLYLLYARNDLLKTERIPAQEGEEHEHYTARLFIPKETIYHQNEIT